MGKLATKQVVIDIEAEYNDEGEIDVVLIVDDEPDYEGFRERMQQIHLTLNDK
jgi:hypothetical protein